MTEHDLHTLVRDHVNSDEPPFQLTPDDTITRGRRTLRRRRAITGGVCAAALATIGAVTVPQLIDSGNGSSGNKVVAGSPDYDASQMPRIIDEHARVVFAKTTPGLPDGVRSVTDSQGTALPEKFWDKASQMTVDYTMAGREFRISLLHARSEAEGDRDTYCQAELASDYSVACETFDVDGRTVISQTMALRRIGDGWAVVPNKKLATFDPDKLWFSHMVEDVRSETLVVTATEVVKASSVEAADWNAPIDDLTSLVTDPELDIPAPPTDKDGCVWSLPITGTSNGVDQAGCMAQADAVEGP
ncbi:MULTISPECIES: hypothetical protein [unclassified Nocardioides]|uniref:hypothetical protein n=1 Tax=unclassified Nocardioides TaxID=2615069 RepID=UPI0007011A74|nr:MULTISPECIES: hypothetical protein [unclassified Nocardioides]KQY63963.1 hypothetical protein ASD30_03005 [Nocardioides sp. Root140]KRF15977.1 hypothetical protein ASH02_05010 [Nocardioides sp. Soil796]